MEGFKGTPLPWKVSFHGSENCWIVDSENDSAIAKVTRYKGDGDVQKANFQLIAAAPELLEALQEMVAIVKKHTYPQPDKPSSTWGRMEAAEAVISKALGQ